MRAASPKPEGTPISLPLPGSTRGSIACSTRKSLRRRWTAPLPLGVRSIEPERRRAGGRQDKKTALKQAPLRIAHTEASVGWGGQEIRILEEAQGMIARGHAVEIWAVAGSGILTEAGRRAIPHPALPIGRQNLRGILAMRRAPAAVPRHLGHKPTAAHT